MNKISLLLSLLFAFSFQASFACHNSSIDNVVAVNNGNGTTTYTIDLSVDVGSLDGRSLGFALVFASSAGTPSVLSSPAFTPTLSRSGYNDLRGYTGTAIGSGMGASATNYFDNRYGNRGDVLTYETDDDFWGFGSTDYTRQVTVTIQGCVETITLDADFRTTGSATPAGSLLCLKVHNTVQVCTVCSFLALTAGAQTPCVSPANTYAQELTLTYTNEPASGTLDVNGQSFIITSSPQTVTLVGLLADANPVTVTAVFSADPACTITSNALFTAPAPCNAVGCTPDNGTWD
jgi:hypothetical protein